MFDHSPDALELFWYATQNFDVVLEYTEHMHEHAAIINSFRSGAVISSQALMRAAVLAKRLSAIASSVYQKQGYDLYGRALAEVAGKEKAL